MYSIGEIKEGSDYKILPHTADMALEVHASNINELFEKCALAVISIVFGFSQYNKVGKKERVEIAVDGEDSESLLIEFLNELLYKIYQMRFVAVEAAVSSKGNSLYAFLSGEYLDKDRFEAEHYIKAATYHNLKIVYKNRML